MFREGLHPDSRELDDYLYDSELNRNDFMDLHPEEKFECYSGTLALHSSTWEVVFKDDDKYDWWHFVCEGTTPYAFEEPAYVAANTFFPEGLRNVKCCARMVVLHKRTGAMVANYRLPKAVSHLMELHLRYRLESFSNGKYHYDLPHDDVGSVNVQMEEAEARENAKDGDPKHGTRS
ncbi:hypothetical protein D3C73_1132110 [compost metagenome]